MYSFDVYDTVITRKVNTPKGIWELMSLWLVENSETVGISINSAMNYTYIREDAERQARKSAFGEITISDIYYVIENNYHLTREVSQKLIDLEMQIEIDNTVPIDETINKIKEFLSLGEEVILISDMYMPSSFFKRIFDKMCPELANLDLYVSCEMGKTKASGLLYKHIADVKKVSYSDWTHEGDNIVSDIHVAELFGINAIHYDRKKSDYSIMRLNNVLEGVHPATSQILLGLIKNMNLDRSNSFAIGYGFVGIALYSYVEWIIKESIERNIHNLFFIARDGYVLKKVADVIIQQYGLVINTFYIYGSRKAWNIDSSEKENLVYEYLQQEMSSCGCDFAFVDTQGTGRTMETIATILGYETRVFYYSLFGSIKKRKIIPICYCNGVGGDIVEVLCRAPHGVTLGYKKEYQSIIPQLTPSVKSEFDNKYMDYIDGVVKFANDYSGIASFCQSIPLGGISVSVMRYCLNTPDYELAEFLGDIPFDTNDSKEIKKYAPKLTIEDLAEIELNRKGRKLEEVYSGSELTISYSRLSQEEQEVLLNYKNEFHNKCNIKYDSAKKIILYGFGKYGKETFCRVNLNPNIEVVRIVDLNNHKFKDVKPRIDAVKTIKSCTYDYIVICLYAEKTVKDVKKMLIASGNDKNKIISLIEFENLLDEL